MDTQTFCLFGGMLAILALSSVIGAILKTQLTSESGKKLVQNLNARIGAWWVMCGVFSIAIFAGNLAVILLFTLISFLALREFITLSPTKRGDHHALFWAFFIILPLHYYVLAIQWYGLFVILIPVYAFLFIPMRNVLAGDTEKFLERTAKIQWSLMVSVYFASHAPALLMLTIPGYTGNAKLLFFLVFVVQISDVFQYVWGKMCGKRPIAPKLSPNKTIEGFIGGALSATAAGALLWWSTPFTWWQAALLSAVIVVMGFFGGLVMSAIKRDRGVKDYGDTIPGHGGIMDRIDSLCFAAPVFFHLVRWCYSA